MLELNLKYHEAWGGLWNEIKSKLLYDFFCLMQNYCLETGTKTKIIAKNCILDIQNYTL